MDVRFTDLKVYLWKGKSVSKMSAVRVRGEPPLHSGSLEVKRATYNRLMLVQVQLRVPLYGSVANQQTRRAVNPFPSGVGGAAPPWPTKGQLKYTVDSVKL